MTENLTDQMSQVDLKTDQEKKGKRHEGTRSKHKVEPPSSHLKNQL